MNKRFFLLLCGILIWVPSLASAHQPRLVTTTPVVVTQPEVSKAYYSKLAGEPQTYRIVATEPFDLYVNVLVPDITGQKKDVSAAIIKDGNADVPLAVLDGSNFEWKKFDEPFGHDTYWAGPEYRARAEAGTYEIRVWSSNNDSKYSLAVGEIEAFDVAETINTLVLIPQLKANFFGKSPADFVFSPIGASYIVVMFILAFIAGFAYRFILRKAAAGSVRGVGQNIGLSDRLVRAALGIALLGWAITTSWNPVLLFLSGFCFFEAIFSWCGLYAALGKSTCPVG